MNGYRRLSGTGMVQEWGYVVWCGLGCVALGHLLRRYQCTRAVMDTWIHCEEVLLHSTAVVAETIPSTQLSRDA